MRRRAFGVLALDDGEGLGLRSLRDEFEFVLGALVIGKGFVTTQTFATRKHEGKNWNKFKPSQIFFTKITMRSTPDN